jgi:flagellar hook-basal body complex protein FliE
MRIEPLVTIEPLRPLQAAQTAPQAAGAPAAAKSFGDMLEQSIAQVNDLQTQADKLTQSLAAGKLEDLHTVMVAMAKASLALEFTIQVRNKVIEAYQELMRTQV